MGVALAPYGFKINTAHSLAVCQTPPTSSVGVVIFIAGQPVGTISWSAGNYWGVISIPPGSENVQPGDQVIFMAPDPADSAFADIAILLRPTVPTVAGGLELGGDFGGGGWDGGGGEVMWP